MKSISVECDAGKSQRTALLLQVKEDLGLRSAVLFQVDSDGESQSVDGGSLLLRGAMPC